MNQEQKIKELEKRIEELERRPIYYPVPYYPPQQPIYPPFYSTTCDKNTS